MTTTSYQTGYPNGLGNNSYNAVIQDTFQWLIDDLDASKIDMNGNYTCTYQGVNGILTNRNDPNDVTIYNLFTPDSQSLPLMEVIFYTLEADGQTFMNVAIAQNPEIDFVEHPELIPPFCVTSSLVDSYEFTIDAV